MVKPVETLGRQKLKWRENILDFSNFYTKIVILQRRSQQRRLSSVDTSTLWVWWAPLITTSVALTWPSGPILRYTGSLRPLITLLPLHLGRRFISWSFFLIHSYYCIKVWAVWQKCLVWLTTNVLTSDHGYCFIASCLKTNVSDTCTKLSVAFFHHWKDNCHIIL